VTDEDDEAVTNGMIDEARRKSMKGHMTSIDEVSRAVTIQASVAVTGGENEIIKISQAVTVMGRDETEIRRQEESLWMGLGGEDANKRMGELGVESNLKSKIIGIKQKEDKICIKQNDNNVGRVNNQVLLELGSDLKLKSHESKFRESLDNKYLSPEKKQRLCEDSIIIPRHTAGQGTRSGRPPLTHSSPGRSGSCKLRSQSRHTLRLTRQARCPPSPSTGRERSGSSTNVGSRASTTKCPPSPPTGRERSGSSTTVGSRVSPTSPG
jgi:hypothetical protein